MFFILISSSLLTFFIASINEHYYLLLDFPKVLRLVLLSKDFYFRHLEIAFCNGPFKGEEDILSLLILNGEMDFRFIF